MFIPGWIVAIALVVFFLFTDIGQGLLIVAVWVVGALLLLGGFVVALGMLAI